MMYRPRTTQTRTPASRPAAAATPPLPSSTQVVFFGRHQMQQSLKWMGAFWASIAASIAAFNQVHVRLVMLCCIEPMLLGCLLRLMHTFASCPADCVDSAHAHHL